MGRADRIVLCAVAAIVGALAPPITPHLARADSLEPLESVVSRVVDASPGRDSSAYSPPSRETMQAISDSVSELMATGSTGLDSYDLERVSVAGDDTATSALIERGDPAPGNGLYVVRHTSDVTSPLIVETAHPVADMRTDHMGTQLFSESDAQLFMLAGAHRTAGGGAADVAHRTDTAFAAVNEAVVRNNTTVVQIHGFSATNHDTDFGDVVLSSTVDEPSAAVRGLGEDLSANGFATCTYDGENCKALAGTTNVEAASARAAGAEFIHIEVDQDVRLDADERRRVVSVIADSLRELGIG